jgi:hypothetical protein
MDPQHRAAEEGFAAIVSALGQRPGVSTPDAAPASGARFGSSALRVHGHIFAMVSAQRLVLKLPAKRVTELLAAGRGSPFDGGKGRPMREWVSLAPEHPDDWLDLATEALSFVGSKG